KRGKAGVILAGMATTLLLVASTALAQTPPPPATPMIGGGGAIPARGTRLPLAVSQGAMVVGNTHPAAIVEYAGRRLSVAPDGDFVFGVGRDEKGPLVVKIKQ